MQGDPLFKEILDRVRYGGCCDEDLAVLESLKDTQFPEGATFSPRENAADAVTAPANAGIRPTRLYAKNMSVDAINLRELLELGGETQEYKSITVGEAGKRWASTNRIPTEV